VKDGTISCCAKRITSSCSGPWNVGAGYMVAPPLNCGVRCHVKDWLKRLWNGPVVADAVHPLFGPMELTRIRGNESWEADRVPFEGRTISVYFNTSQSQPPSDAQVKFFHGVTGNLDATFQRVAPVLLPAYEAIYGPFEGRWNDTFELVGIEVPAEGNPDNPWLLQYQTPKHRHELFTVYFRAGKPEGVGCDT